MKSISWAMIFAGALLLTSWAQDAAEIARRQAMEENYKRMMADNEILMERQTALQKRIESLSEKVAMLEERLARSTNGAVSRKDLNSAFDRLTQEIENKRKEDKEFIIRKIDEIRKLIRAAPLASPPATAERRDAPERDGYEYQVKEGELLGSIVRAYNEKFKSEGRKTITVSDVLNANPKLDPKRMRAGQTILIPKPAEK